MKRHTLTLVAAMGVVGVFGLGNACANGPMNMPNPVPKTAPAPGSGTNRLPPASYTPLRGHPPGRGLPPAPPVIGHGRPVPPISYVTPRTYPPVRVVPRVVPPAVVPVPFTAIGGGTVTMGAWVGYNAITGRYSVAFDSPGIGGLGILIQSGFDVIVLGPTTWAGATTYLKSVGAPGW